MVGEQISALGKKELPSSEMAALRVGCTVISSPSVEVFKKS